VSLGSAFLAKNLLAKMSRLAVCHKNTVKAPTENKPYNLHCLSLQINVTTFMTLAWVQQVWHFS